MDHPYIPIDELDALIEEALRDEPLLKAPVSLHRTVDARLRIMAMREHEKRRFQLSMITLLGLFFACIACAGMLLWFTSLSSLYNEGVSGGRGWVDYYANALFMYVKGYQGTYSLIASFILAIATVMLAGMTQFNKFLHME